MFPNFHCDNCDNCDNCDRFEAMPSWILPTALCVGFCCCGWLRSDVPRDEENRKRHQHWRMTDDIMWLLVILFSKRNKRTEYIYIIIYIFIHWFYQPESPFVLHLWAFWWWLDLKAGRLGTAGARIIERSQEYKSTVKYRTFVLLRVPIPRGVGKFNYRTGIRSIIKFPRSIIKFPRSIISGTDLIFTADLYI